MRRTPSSAALLVLMAACSPAARQAAEPGTARPPATVTNLHVEWLHEPMTTTPTTAGPARPPIDLRAHAQLRTATFALG